MFVGEDSTEGVKSSLLLGLLVCLLCVCVFFFLVMYTRHPVFHLASGRLIYACYFGEFLLLHFFNAAFVAVSLNF